MQAHHRRLLWNVQDHLCMRDGFGFLGTIGGTEAGMCGCVAVGSTRLDGELWDSGLLGASRWGLCLDRRILAVMHIPWVSS